MNVNKEKLVGVTGSVSGATSVLGSWQICHNLCLGSIALLGILGITFTGMPLLFLTKLAIPFWTIAFVLLLLTLIFHAKRNCVFQRNKRCSSHKLIIFNSGLLIAGIPFKPLQPYSPIFWIIGGAVMSVSIIQFISSKFQKMRVKA